MRGAATALSFGQRLVRIQLHAKEWEDSKSVMKITGRYVGYATNGVEMVAPPERSVKRRDIRGMRIKVCVPLAYQNKMSCTIAQVISATRSWAIIGKPVLTNTERKKAIAESVTLKISNSGGVQNTCATRPKNRTLSALLIGLVMAIGASASIAIPAANGIGTVAIADVAMSTMWAVAGVGTPAVLQGAHGMMIITIAHAALPWNIIIVPKISATMMFTLVWYGRTATVSFAIQVQVWSMLVHGRCAKMRIFQT